MYIYELLMMSKYAKCIHVLVYTAQPCGQERHTIEQITQMVITIIIFEDA